MKSLEPLAAALLLLELEGATVLPMVASMSVYQGQLTFYRRDLCGISGQVKNLSLIATAVARFIMISLKAFSSMQPH